MQSSHRVSERIRNTVSELDQPAEVSNHLRFICLPSGHSTNYNGITVITNLTHFAPSTRTCLCIMQGMQQAMGGHRQTYFRLRDDAMLQKWTQMLVEDLWENTSGLDASQQLFALACVKCTIPRWLGWSMDIYGKW